MELNTINSKFFYYKAWYILPSLLYLQYINKTEKEMRIYTSKEILESEDLYELQDTFCSSGIPFKYEMTQGEIEYLGFIKNRYSIYDWITENLEGNILTFDDMHGMSKAIYYDGIPFKAVMLSDNTALQRLFFWLSEEILSEEIED